MKENFPKMVEHIRKGLQLALRDYEAARDEVANCDPAEAETMTAAIDDYRWRADCLRAVTVCMFGLHQDLEVYAEEFLSTLIASLVHKLGDSPDPDATMAAFGERARNITEIYGSIDSLALEAERKALARCVGAKGD